MADISSEERNNVLEGYKQLGDMLRHEENLFWKRMETFLVTSSALIAILGLLWPSTEATSSIPQTTPRIILGLLLALIGAVMCLGWLVVISRSEAFYNHWYEQIKYIEKEYLKPLAIFETADTYFATGKVIIGGEPFGLPWHSKIARIYHVMFLAPGLFLLTWTLILLYLLLLLLPEVSYQFGAGLRPFR